MSRAGGGAGRARGPESAPSRADGARSGGVPTRARPGACPVAARFAHGRGPGTHGRGPVATGAGQGSATARPPVRAIRPGLRPVPSRGAECGVRPPCASGRARCACRSRTGAVAPDRRWGGAHDDGDDDGDIGAGARWALLRVFPRAGAAGPVRPVDHRQGVAPPVFRAAGKRSGGLRLSGPDGPSWARAHRTRRLGGTRPSRTTRLCSPVRRRGTAAGGRCGA